MHSYTHTHNGIGSRESTKVVSRCSEIEVKGVLIGLLVGSSNKIYLKRLERETDKCLDMGRGREREPLKIEKRGEREGRLILGRVERERVETHTAS